MQNVVFKRVTILFGPRYVCQHGLFNGYIMIISQPLWYMWQCDRNQNDMVVADGLAPIWRRDGISTTTVMNV